tara:strand:- start:72 stop:296 length:225 start_codon:yes stop_codon:yes gene_type:complete
MQKNLRVQVIKDLYAEITKSRTGDLSRAIDFLKKAREVHQGKSNQRKQARKNYENRKDFLYKKFLEKADLPFWW